MSEDEHCVFEVNYSVQMKVSYILYLYISALPYEFSSVPNLRVYPTVQTRKTTGEEGILRKEDAGLEAFLKNMIPLLKFDALCFTKIVGAFDKCRKRVVHHWVKEPKEWSLWWSSVVGQENSEPLV